jgi:hypothetical protein
MQTTYAKEVKDIKRISISNAQVILDVIGEEDSIGLDKDESIQAALLTISLKIEELVEKGQISESDILVTFR